SLGTASTMERCIAHHNYEGITVGQNYSSGAVVRDCTASFNYGYGIRVAGTDNRIDSNLVVSNSAVGIKIEGTRNLIVRNKANKNAVGYAGNSNNYLIPAGNKWGRIVEDDGEISSGSGWENFSEPSFIP